MSNSFDHETSFWQNSNQSNRNKLFVGGWTYNTIESDLKKYFSKYCKILDCVIMIDKTTGHSRGFGFISVEDIKQIDTIIKNQPHVIKGKKVECKVAKPKEIANYTIEEYPSPNTNTEATSDTNRDEKTWDENQISYPNNDIANCKIFIGGLHQMVTETEWNKYFSSYGEIRQSIIMKDKITGKSRGFGFLIFKSSTSVDKVLSYKQEHYIFGKYVECKRATPREWTTPKWNHSNPMYINMYENNNSLFEYQNYFPVNTANNTKTNQGNYSYMNYPYCNNNIPVYCPSLNFKNYHFTSINQVKPSPDQTDTDHHIPFSQEQNKSSSYNAIKNDNENSTIPNPYNKSKSSVISPFPQWNPHEKDITFKNFFNSYWTNPQLYNYFHYKWFDKNGEEISKLNWYKNTDQLILFKDKSTSDNKISDSSSNGSVREVPRNESTSELLLDKEYQEELDVKSEENCFGPKKDNIKSNLSFNLY